MRCPECFKDGIHRKLSHTKVIECRSGPVRVAVHVCHCDYCGNEYLDDEAQAKIVQVVMRAIHREELAEYAHEAWSGWMRHLFSKCAGAVGD
ncbi:unnamed protein product, partial [marine sediment metagenome]